MKKRDHAPLIEAITSVTRQTAMKVLICPEDDTQIEVEKKICSTFCPTMCASA
jgi:hypothetical protein